MFLTRTKGEYSETLLQDSAIMILQLEQVDQSYWNSTSSSSLQSGSVSRKGCRTYCSCTRLERESDSLQKNQWTRNVFKKEIYHDLEGLIFSESPSRQIRMKATSTGVPSSQTELFLSNNISVRTRNSQKKKMTMRKQETLTDSSNCQPTIGTIDFPDIKGKDRLMQGICTSFSTSSSIEEEWRIRSLEMGSSLL